jgi:hypothetical protein
VAVGQRQRLYSGVKMFTWFHLGSINMKFVITGSKPYLIHWYCPAVTALYRINIHTPILLHGRAVYNGMGMRGAVRGAEQKYCRAEVNSEVPFLRKVYSTRPAP